jgi:hypothetical protein
VQETFPFSIQVLPVGNGRIAHDTEHYENRGTEIWVAIRDRLKDNIMHIYRGNQILFNFQMVIG